MKPIAAQILAILKRSAKAGEHCPTNLQMGDEIGVSGPTVLNYLNAMEREGVIEIIRGQARRVVIIVESGLRTAGEVKALHWRFREAEGAVQTGKEAWRQAKEHSERRALESLHAKLAKDERAASLYVERDPCIRCGVRADRHAEFGCGSYRT